MRSDWLVPLFIAGLIMLDWLSRLFYSFDIDRFEGDALPTRWIAWGWVKGCGTDRYLHRYFMVRFPSYRWDVRPWRIDGKGEWTQLAWLWIGPWGTHRPQSTSFFTRTELLP